MRAIEMNKPHPTVDRNGRIFLASDSSVSMEYTLPVDLEHLDSLDGVHYMLKDFIGSNYYDDGTVKHALAEDPSRRKCVVDFGCGAGTWVRDMAQEFPHVDFVGLDIVDAWDRLETEPSNVQFVIDDLRKHTQLANESFDVVHMRHMRTGIEFSRLIDEATRLLRPGGLLLTTDWSRNLTCTDEHLPSSADAPAVAELFELLAVTIESGLPYTDAEKMPMLIQDSGRFMDVRSTQYALPVGTCHPTERYADIGSQMIDLIITYFDSLRPLCREHITGEKFEDLRADALGEMRTKPGMATPVYMTIARKI